MAYFFLLIKVREKITYAGGLVFVEANVKR
jgi:hypothetical protein